MGVEISGRGFFRHALAVVAVLGSMVAYPSLSTAGWTDPAPVSGIGTSVSQTRVAGAADGASWAVWKRDVAGFDVIQGARISADGAAGPVQTISALLSQATDPVLAVRADGSAMVAWLDRSTPADSVYSRSIASDGTFGPIKARSAIGPVGQPAGEISLALGADGSAGIAWRKFNGTYWVAQATTVTSDGSSGTIHDLSEPTGSARSVDIAAAPPAVEGGSSSYRAVWARGTGDDGNVYSRDISGEDVLDVEPIQLLWNKIPEFLRGPVGPGRGGAPHDVQVAYEDNGSMSIAWVRYRTDYFVRGFDDTMTKNPFRTKENGYPFPYYDPSDPDDDPFYTWAVETVRTYPGVPLSNKDAQPIFPLTPNAPDDPYNVEDLEISVPHGGEVMMAWVHDLNGGGERVESGRYLKTLFRQWINGAPAVPSALDPVVVGNDSSTAVVGWTEPGAGPSQEFMRMRRFSDTLIGQPFTPSGDDFDLARDPGFVVADNGNTLAVFTAVDEQGIGSVRMIRFTSPGVRVDTKSLVFGPRDIGVPKTMPIVIRSSGETPVGITGVELSGPDADRFMLDGVSDCIRKYAYQATCTVRVVYDPNSVASHTAKVTITSEVGVDEVELSGSGMNRTRNLLTLSKPRFSAKAGKTIAVQVLAENKGGVASQNTRVCVNLRKRALLLAGARCRSLGELVSGAPRTLDYRIRVKARAPKGVDLPVAFVMSSDNTVERKVVAQVRRVGR